jgi:hypothetical protein
MAANLPIRTTLWAAIAYWPVVLIGLLFQHAAAWQGGPNGFAEKVLFYFFKLLTPLPYGLLVNWVFAILCVFTAALLYRKITNYSG